MFPKLSGVALSVIALAMSASPATACPNCKKDHAFGPAKPMGNGMAWAWVRYDKESKKPAAVGITMTETSLQGLPVEVPAGMIFMEEVLELPEGTKDLPFTHATINWNPKGHIPPGIYDVPHFDYHFFTIGQKTQQGITAKDGDLARCAKAPAAKFVPAGYILPPGTIEPKMGAHWVHPASPELNGKPFTSTFIYGSYNGRTAFLEPMVATSFLDKRETIELDIPQAEAVDRSGYYPSKYKVSFNAERKEFTISLEGLTYRKATR